MIMWFFSSQILKFHLCFSSIVLIDDKNKNELQSSWNSHETMNRSRSKTFQFAVSIAMVAILREFCYPKNAVKLHNVSYWVDTYLLE